MPLHVGDLQLWGDARGGRAGVSEPGKLCADPEGWLQPLGAWELQPHWDFVLGSGVPGQNNPWLHSALRSFVSSCSLVKCPRMDVIETLGFFSNRKKNNLFFPCFS